MLRIWFASTLLLKLIVWGVMWVGIYVAVRAFIDGKVALGLVILILVIPVALFVARIVLGISQMIVLLPISIVLGRRRDFIEFSRFQLAVADALGADRLTLRAGWKLMRMFETLPPRQSGAPARSGEELLALLPDVWEHEEVEAAYAAFEDEGETEPPRPALGQPPPRQVSTVVQPAAQSAVGDRMYVFSGWDFQCPDGATGPGQIWNLDVYSFSPQLPNRFDKGRLGGP